MAEDRFAYTPDKVDDPADTHFEITPNDSADLEKRVKALYVGGEGDIAVVDKEGTEVIYQNVFGILPVRAVRIRSTGTTATNIIGLY